MHKSALAVLAASFQRIVIVLFSHANVVILVYSNKRALVREREKERALTIAGIIQCLLASVIVVCTLNHASDRGIIHALLVFIDQLRNVTHQRSLHILKAHRHVFYMVFGFGGDFVHE